MRNLLAVILAFLCMAFSIDGANAFLETKETEETLPNGDIKKTTTNTDVTIIPYENKTRSLVLQSLKSLNGLKSLSVPQNAVSSKSIKDDKNLEGFLAKKRNATALSIVRYAKSEGVEPSYLDLAAITGTIPSKIKSILTENVKASYDGTLKVPFSGPFGLKEGEMAYLTVDTASNELSFKKKTASGDMERVSTSSLDYGENAFVPYEFGLLKGQDGQEWLVMKTLSFDLYPYLRIISLAKQEGDYTKKVEKCSGKRKKKCETITVQLEGDELAKAKDGWIKNGGEALRSPSNKTKQVLKSVPDFKQCKLDATIFQITPASLVAHCNTDTGPKSIVLLK